MENIYKIKVCTKLDPRWQYPSERRYSASIVLGLGVVHLALASTAFLLACLTLNYGESSTSGRINSSYNMNFLTVLTFAPCIMCLGSIGAGLTALLAWKRWYVDHNITWFFCMSFASTITSSTCLALIAILISSFNFSENTHNNIRFVITLNILITSILEWLWSCLSTKIAFVGMRNDYPDDISLKQVHVHPVHTKHKSQIIPSNIVNYFSPEISRKLAKYLVNSNRKVGNNNLPKDESHSEYRERVNKFLSSTNSDEIQSNV